MTTALLGNRLVIGNDAAELRRMSQWLRDSAAAADIAPDLVFALDHCANEAVINIIDYAYDDAARHDITLELNRTAEGACMVIRDDGKPFNLLQAPEHENCGCIADAKIGGLGIHLIRCLMARCEYRREDGENVLTLEANLDPRQANAQPRR